MLAPNFFKVKPKGKNDKWESCCYISVNKWIMNSKELCTNIYSHELEGTTKMRYF